MPKRKYKVRRTKINDEFYLIPQTEFHELSAMLENRFQSLTGMIHSLRSKLALITNDHFETPTEDSAPVTESDGTPADTMSQTELHS